MGQRQLERPPRRAPKLRFGARPPPAKRGERGVAAGSRRDGVGEEGRELGFSRKVPSLGGSRGRKVRGIWVHEGDEMRGWCESRAGRGARRRPRHHACTACSSASTVALGGESRLRFTSSRESRRDDRRFCNPVRCPRPAGGGGVRGGGGFMHGLRSSTRWHRHRLRSGPRRLHARPPFEHPVVPARPPFRPPVARAQPPSRPPATSCTASVLSPQARSTRSCLHPTPNEPVPAPRRPTTGCNGLAPPQPNPNPLPRSMAVFAETAPAPSPRRR